MKILAISDTHTFHNQLPLPAGLDMIIHAGDFADEKDSGINANQCIDFLMWYNSLPIKHKILIAGNHDTAVERGLIDPRTYETITFLDHESVEIEGIKIFGSPYTPSFGVGWAYNVPRGKLTSYWNEIPEDTDILVTHGPPQGMLDLSEDRARRLEFCGDKELLNKLLRLKVKYNIFGHIHSNSHIGCYNAGMRTTKEMETVFINASCVYDGRKDLGLVSFGTVFEYKQ